MATVKNATGTSDLDCECGSWINHWEKSTKDKAKGCVVVPCKNSDNSIGLHGGHVKRQDKKDDTMYIVPLCGEHNNYNNTSDMVVSDSHLVAATKGKSC